MKNTTFWVSKITTKMTIKITLNCQGGNASKYETVGVIGEKIGELPIPTYDNKFFNGWYTSSIGGERITQYTIVTEAMRIIYAQWIDPVEIEWDATTNGGTLVPLEEEHYYYPTQPFGKLPSANGTAELPYLDSWWTTPDDSGEKISPSSIVGDIRKFYAHYINYNDPIGKVICPTKNLEFTIQDSGTIALEEDSTYWLNGDTQPVYFTCNDYQQATLKSTITGPGTLSFYASASTEGSYDGLVFLMDVNYNSSIYEMSYNYVIGDMNNPPYVSANGITGDTSWKQITLDIPDGEHEIYWVYTRDGSASSGQNKVWITQAEWYN